MSSCCFCKNRSSRSKNCAKEWSIAKNELSLFFFFFLMQQDQIFLSIRRADRATAAQNLVRIVGRVGVGVGKGAARAQRRASGRRVVVYVDLCSVLLVCCSVCCLSVRLFVCFDARRFSCCDQFSSRRSWFEMASCCCAFTTNNKQTTNKQRP